jgi:hypothetical protein
LPALNSLLDRGIKIKILVDNTWDYFQIKINSITKKKVNNPIQIGYLNKLGRFDEMILISDGKYVLQVRYNQDNRMIASFTNEKYKVQVQEIMFEKHWNEVKSLNVLNIN